MSDPVPPIATGAPGGVLAAPGDTQPHDRCVRCGAVTPAGQALCARHNPGGISGPSATQMHATILAGVLLGFIGFLILMRFATGSTGPFGVRVLGSEAGPDGTTMLTFSIVNEGAGEGIADCRVTRDGVPRPDDLAFRTERLPVDAPVVIERVLPALPAGSALYVPDLVSVICT